MKIYATTARQYVLGFLASLIWCVWIGLLVGLVLDPGWAYVVAAVLLPVFVVRMVLVSRRRWVYVDAHAVAWSTPTRAGFNATPTGSVSLDQVTDYRTVPQAIRRRSG